MQESFLCTSSSSRLWPCVVPTCLGTFKLSRLITPTNIDLKDVGKPVTFTVPFTASYGSSICTTPNLRRLFSV